MLNRKKIKKFFCWNAPEVLSHQLVYLLIEIYSIVYVTKLPYHPQQNKKK